MTEFPSQHHLWPFTEIQSTDLLLLNQCSNHGCSLLLPIVLPV